MKSIIMVKHMDCEASALKIQQGLKQVGISCEVLLERNSIVLEGNNDQVRFAKNFIQELGFEVM